MRAMVTERETMTSHNEQVSNCRIAHKHFRQAQGIAQTISKMLLDGTGSNIVWERPVHEIQEVMEMPRLARQRMVPERVRSEVRLQESAGNVDNHCLGNL